MLLFRDSSKNEFVEQVFFSLSAFKLHFLQSPDNLPLGQHGHPWPDLQDVRGHQHLQGALLLSILLCQEGVSLLTCNVNWVLATYTSEVK